MIKSVFKLYHAGCPMLSLFHFILLFHSYYSAVNCVPQLEAGSVFGFIFQSDRISDNLFVVNSNEQTVSFWFGLDFGIHVVFILAVVK